MNERYADLPDDTKDFGSCSIEDSSGPCVALHAGEAWRVEIPPAEREMFVHGVGSEWSPSENLKS